MTDDIGKQNPPKNTPPQAAERPAEGRNSGWGAQPYGAGPAHLRRKQRSASFFLSSTVSALRGGKGTALAVLYVPTRGSCAGCDCMAARSVGRSSLQWLESLQCKQLTLVSCFLSWSSASHTGCVEQAAVSVSSPRPEADRKGHRQSRRYRAALTWPSGLQEVTVGLINSS